MSDKRDLRKFIEFLKKDKTSYPYVFMYGVEGTGGLMKTRNVPKKYVDNYLWNLPIERDNPEAYGVVQKFCDSPIEKVNRGRGLYLFSVPNKDNKFGTGTGKTTSAVTMLNHYILARGVEHVLQENPIKDNPVYFCKGADLQTKFNSQFRGTPEMQREGSLKYYKMKDRIKDVELLVLDDIATKATSEAYTEELYEIIDYRSTNELFTIYTSNLTYDELGELLGSRLQSRIEGMTIPVCFKGKDNRSWGM